MLRITLAESEGEIKTVEVLFKEYSDWCKKEFVRTGILKADAPELDTFNSESLPGDYKPPTGFLMLAYNDDTPIGCMFFHKLHNDVGELKRFYLRPAVRGKGYAIEMLDAFCREAKKRGYTRLRITSHHFMQKAIDIYRRYGFYDIDNYVSDPLQAGVAYMELNLETQVFGSVSKS